MFEVSLALLPSNAYALLHRGLMQEALGNAEAARASFEAARNVAEEMGQKEVLDLAKKKLGT